MSMLVFTSEEALQLALTSGLVPAEVQAAPARYQRTPDGALHVQPEVMPEKDVLARLASLGVQVTRARAKDATPVLCWAEMVTARPVPLESAPSGPVLFLPPSAETLLPLAGEMLRLGCDRQEVCFARSKEQRALLRAVAPPYFTLTSALDATGPLRAFLPAVPGQHTVWVEVGYSHPLARTLQAPTGTLLLIHGKGPWLTAPDGPWTDLYQHTDLRLPAPGEDWTSVPAPGRLTVPLRLTRAARTEPASLWVLRENALAQVESLVHTLPEPLLAQLRFAVSGTPDAPCIVLRARSGRERPPELGLSGMAYAPLPQLTDLFLPCDGLLEPPVRRDRLRALLVPQADTVTWLHPTGGGAFRAERLPESAFQPLDTWVDYIVDTSADALMPWVRSATFDFAAFEAAEGEWQSAARAAQSDEPSTKSPKGTRRARREEPTPEEAPTPPPPIVAVRVAQPAAPGARMAPLTAAQMSDVEKELGALEKAFLALEVPADSPQRQALWIHMAELNGRLGRKRDASLCWTRALWSASDTDAAELARRWADSEAEGAASPTERLSAAAPTGDDVRGIASGLVRAARAPDEAAPGDVATLQRWLDRHDADLDVRSVWLTRTALDTLAGGDALGLARAGDRLMEMLQRGLSPARDVPRFLRGGADVAHAPRVVAQLEALLDRFEHTPRRRSSIEAEPALTLAYVRYVFAVGLARLGQTDRPRALASEAAKAVDAKEAIHGFLSRAYGARVAQALEGQPPETPLPPDIAAELNALGTFQRYKVDRLRQASALLEPSERLDPARAFGRGAKDLRGEEFATLRDLKDPAQVAAQIESLTGRATDAKQPLEERQRLIGGLLDTLPRVAPACALPLLNRLVASLDPLPRESQAVMLGDALTLAALFGRADHARTLAGRLREVLTALPPASPAWSQGILGVSLRSLRRVGLSGEAATLVDAARERLAGPKTPLTARLGVAAGLSMQGRTADAVDVFDAAFESLRAMKGALPDRLALMRSLASALAHAPVELALPGLARISEGLPSVTDSYNTNSHFCLSVVELADSLVQGHVEVAQGTGERARSWLDEDEFLVRRRIHQELEQRT